MVGLWIKEILVFERKGTQINNLILNNNKPEVNVKQLVVIGLFILVLVSNVFGQTKKQTVNKGIPFANDNIQGILFFGKTFDGLEVHPTYQYEGIHTKLRQETRSGKMQFGASGTFLLANVEDKDLSIKDKRFGAGPSFAWSSRRTWTDLDLQYQRIERKISVGKDIEIEDRVNLIDVSLMIDWRKQFESGFSLSGAKLYFEYMYPLNSQRVYTKGAPGKKEAASQVKSSYIGLEVTWYSQQISKEVAFTSFFIGRHDHQSWNVSDNYTLGVGGRFYLTEGQEIGAIRLTNRFRVTSSEGEPTFNLDISILPLFRLF